VTPNCPEPVVQSLQLTCERLEKLELRIVTTSRWAIGTAVPVIVAILGAAIALYAQSERESVQLISHIAVDEVREASAQNVRARQGEVKETLAATVARMTALEQNATDFRETLRENNSILRELAQRIGGKK
jgi:hypothetical protein